MHLACLTLFAAVAVDVVVVAVDGVAVVGDVPASLVSKLSEELHRWPCTVAIAVSLHF